MSIDAYSTAGLTQMMPLGISSPRSPTTSDLIDKNGAPYLPGQTWANTTTHVTYIYQDSGVWINAASSSNLTTVHTGSGDATVAANAITIAGTANQISTSGASSTVTLAIPSAFVAPGSIVATTSIASTTTLTGGTGVTATTGDIVSTAGAVSANTTVTAGTGITSTTGNISATAGAVNAGTSITATNGNITATLGNLVLNGAAKQIQIHGGAVTDFIGQATLSSGTIDVANTNISASDRVFITRASKGTSTAYGSYTVTITAATKFNVTAQKADTTTETNDNSVLNYLIVRQV